MTEAQPAARHERVLPMAQILGLARAGVSGGDGQASVFGNSDLNRTDGARAVPVRNARRVAQTGALEEAYKTYINGILKDVLKDIGHEIAARESKGEIHGDMPLDRRTIVMHRIPDKEVDARAKQLGIDRVDIFAELELKPGLSREFSVHLSILPMQLQTETDDQNLKHDVQYVLYIYEKTMTYPFVVDGEIAPNRIRALRQG